MTTQVEVLENPFILHFQGEPDSTGFDEATRLERLLLDSYDPEEQICRASVFAGTHMTYCHSGTGNVVFSDDDRPDDDT